MKNYEIGIDFGTTNTYAVGIINGNLEMLGTYQSRWSNIYDVKRFIGRTYSDNLVQQICKKYPCEIVNKNGDIRFKINMKNKECYISPEEICSEVLKKFRHVSGKNANIVLTVPAYFTIKQRQAMMEAAKLGEINVICLLEEPIAAFIGHLDEVKDTNGLSMVFHLGKYTFDTTILEYSDCEIVVKCIDGDYMLGGNDFDKAVYDYFMNVYELNDKKCRRDVKQYCQEIKHDLTHKTQFKRILSNFYKNGNHIELNITRNKFEEIADPLFKRCMDIVKRCLTKNYINKRDIKNVILVGGSTRIPKIKELLSNFFENSKIVQLINPHETVAIGAAHYAHIYKTPFGKTLVPTTSNNF